MTPIGTAVREAREAKGLRRETLAHETGLSYGTIVAIEQGRYDPRVGTLVQLARALEIPGDKLLKLLGLAKRTLRRRAA